MSDSRLGFVLLFVRLLLVRLSLFRQFPLLPFDEGLEGDWGEGGVLAGKLSPLVFYQLLDRDAIRLKVLAMR